MTFACRAKFESLPGDGENMVLIAIADHDADDSFHIFINNSGGTYLFATNERDGSADHYAFLAFAANTTDWFHFAGVFNDTTRECYVNGSGPGTDNGDGGANATGLSRTMIAAILAFSTIYHPLDGLLAESATYDAALNSAEIASLAKSYSPLFVRPQSLSSHWRLIRDEDQDIVGGHDMTAYNTPGIAAHPPMVYPAPVHIAYITAAVPDSMA